jgi:hypothetical protein
MRATEETNTLPINPDPDDEFIALTDDQLVERATTAYQRWCSQHGCLFQQPCKYSSEVKRGAHSIEITLANMRGELARYAVRNGRLRRADVVNNDESPSETMAPDWRRRLGGKVRS